jgi:hypothetical protein
MILLPDDLPEMTRAHAETLIMGGASCISQRSKRHPKAVGHEEHIETDQGRIVLLTGNSPER